MSLFVAMRSPREPKDPSTARALELDGGPARWARVAETKRTLLAPLLRRYAAKAMGALEHHDAVGRTLVGDVDVDLRGLLAAPARVVSRACSGTLRVRPRFVPRTDELPAASAGYGLGRSSVRRRALSV